MKLRLRQEGFECINQPSSRAPAPPQPEDGPIDVYDLLRASQTPSERLRPRPAKRRSRLRLYCLRILIGLALLAAAEEPRPDVQAPRHGMPGYIYMCRDCAHDHYDRLNAARREALATLKAGS